MTSHPENHIHTMNQKGFKELAEVELVGKTTHPSKTCHNNFFSRIHRRAVYHCIKREKKRSRTNKPPHSGPGCGGAELQQGLRSIKHIQLVGPDQTVKWANLPLQDLKHLFFSLIFGT
jgi:hypothetical protein